MEYQRVFYRCSFNVSEFMLKGDCMCCKTDSCFIDGSQFGGLVDRPSSRLMPWSFIMEYFRRDGGTKLTPMNLYDRRNRTFNGPFEGRYQPAKIQSIPAIEKATQRYYKLHCGNVLDTETGTILNRDALLEILD
ncbi:hypothetical protein LCGC14_1979330 [marine sediment metagenome]|uniref:Uncharacterized protein n=2 Tax=marine sediment metagenome TaxID=412755 RepID=A0A0F9HMP3_9ZZZZ